MARAALVIGMMLAACEAASTSPGLPTPEPRASHLIIVGTDENHVVITEPLIEVIPPAGADDATVVVAFQGGEPLMLGIEGGLAFLRAHAPDGTVVMDQIVALEGDTVTMPPGDYVLLAYYRSCDGSCGLLDPQHDFCSVDAAVDASGRYELSVSIAGSGRSECTFRHDG